MEIQSDQHEPLPTRRCHLRLESSVRSLGFLCYLVGGVSVLGTVEFLLFLLGVIPSKDLGAIDPTLLKLSFLVGTLLLGFNALAQFILGFGLIRLHAWARWTLIILTGLSLSSSVLTSLALCFAPEAAVALNNLVGWKLSALQLGLSSLVLGLAIHLLLLWPLVAPGSGMVFSAAYRDIVRKTPQIRPRLHWLLKLFVGCLIMLVLGFLGYLGALYLRLID